MKLKSKSKKPIIKIDHDYLKQGKDYRTLHKFIKYTVVASLIIITVIAINKALSDDGTKLEAGLTKIDEYISKPNFKTEDSIKAFSESFADIYFSSNISDSEKKELLQQYSQLSFSELKVKFKENVQTEVINTSCSNIEELTNDLINVTVFTTVKFSELITQKTETTEEKIKSKIINYKLKLPILKKQVDGEFYYSLINSPSFERVETIDEIYEPLMEKLTRVDQFKSNDIEETVRSFLKVFHEGTNQEIIYFYKGENPPKGLLGGFNILDFNKIDVFEMEGGESYVAYASISVKDEFDTEYKNSYEMILKYESGKYYITEFGTKSNKITQIEN